MKFEHFQRLMQQVFPLREGEIQVRYEETDARRLPSLVLAYLGDAYYNLYIRTSLLAFEQNKVRVLHGYGAKMVSATYQAVALRELENELSEEEASVVRRGRNTKSTPTKNASVSDYRSSTGLEALIGYLYLSGQTERLFDICSRIFTIISGKLAISGTEGKGE